ncbi:hypothetical protein [Nitrosomonas sp.]|uniref:hypothetical protein n=1 Tax=Nitrosomonas sp. TaxID=42353 RepID=UPI001DB901BD|nr:hypothetical protein [Nitrosomonas sp.]MCB1948934.1 hypothetical protein [Nitrosomonas sp.]MCP5243097.1 hypothetical protein [Burkholderiales bacterium]MDR4513880.1 hypothetical protein [Nitrosomonas sp.]
METTAPFVIAYLATGIALIGYDFAAPSTHKKDYVSKGKLGSALITWFLWPAAAFMDSYYATKKGKAGINLALGVILIFISIFFMASLFFHFVGSASALVYLVCFVIAVLFSPFLAALALPSHDKL